MAYRENSYSIQLSDQKQKIESVMESMVTCLYQAHIADFWRNVTIVWGKNVMNYTLCVSVGSMESDHVSLCRVELKPWQFWGKKGYKRFEVDGNQLDVYWDFKLVKYSGGPEPVSDYYVALVSEEEVVLLLGDSDEKAYQRAKVQPAIVEAVMVYKKEHVFSKKSFSTRAKFVWKKRGHNIVVESSTSGPREPEMWINIDGIVLIHIWNLQWKFRGNQTILINKQPVEVFWDVHAWLFCTQGSNLVLFIFKPGSQEADSDVEDDTPGEESDFEGSKFLYKNTYII